MAPKRDAASRARKALTPERSDPEDKSGSDDNEGSEEEFEPPLNQAGASPPAFDPVVAPPTTGKGKAQASSSTLGYQSNPLFDAARLDRDTILEQQAEQQEQLRQLFSLVSALGSEIRTAVQGNSLGQSTADTKSVSSQQKKVTFRDATLELGVDDDEEDDEVVDDNRRFDNDDGYVSHTYYRDYISEGFSKRSPSRLAANKPAYFPIDDPVTRQLNASKYSAKATEYSITVANAFFTSITKAALDDVIAAHNGGADPTAISDLLGRVQANMAAMEDMHRDRMLYLDLTSDPSSSATEKDYANNVLRNEFTPGVQNKGGSARSNKVFAAYQLQFLKATQFASAKATANRHLASSTGSGYGPSTPGSGSSTAPNPSSKTQLKKKNAREKAAAGGRPATAGEKEAPAGGRPPRQKQADKQED